MGFEAHGQIEIEIQIQGLDRVWGGQHPVTAGPHRHQRCGGLHGRARCSHQRRYRLRALQAMPRKHHFTPDIACLIAVQTCAPAPLFQISNLWAIPAIFIADLPLQITTSKANNYLESRLLPRNFRAAGHQQSSKQQAPCRILCAGIRINHNPEPLSPLKRNVANTAGALLPGLVDEGRVAVIGGSHGGFLTGNLVGQFPGRFRCGALRNPVMDISLMVHLSDIPDWCYVEAWGSQVTFQLPPTSFHLPASRFHLPASSFTYQLPASTYQCNDKNIEL